MPRVKIDLPDQFTFKTEIPLYIEHINHGKHLDNARLLSLVSEARVRFLASMGYSELDVEGVGIIVADAAVRYRSEVFQGEVLVFEMTADDFNEIGCDFVYRVSEKETGREVAQGKTGIVFFDYEARSPTSVPAGFREKIGCAA